jgi:hypothetical protein
LQQELQSLLDDDDFLNAVPGHLMGVRSRRRARRL